MKTISEVWPEWNIEKEIGRGSYGSVYKCSKEINGVKEYSAIKVIAVPQSEYEMIEIASEKMTNEQSKKYYKDIADVLVKEIEILKTLKGTKNIVEIYDAEVVEKEDGIGWYILIRMELLTDFNTYSSDKKFTESEVIKLGLDISSALSVCHKAKIIHRDIKPENIFVDADGNFKLGDFGVAKQMEKTQGSMSVKGTYNYMSPEVFSGKKSDGRADMYSLALVMYKLLNNDRLPYLDPDKQLIRYNERQAAFEKRIKGEQIPDIKGVSKDLNDIILKACAFKSTDRQRNINEFKKQLEKILKGKKIKNKSVKSKFKKACSTILIFIVSMITIPIVYFNCVELECIEFYGEVRPISYKELLEYKETPRGYEEVLETETRISILDYMDGFTFCFSDGNKISSYVGEWLTLGIIVEIVLDLDVSINVDECIRTFKEGATMVPVEIYTPRYGGKTFTVENKIVKEIVSELRLIDDLPENISRFMYEDKLFDGKYFEITYGNGTKIIDRIYRTHSGLGLLDSADVMFWYDEDVLVNDTGERYYYSRVVVKFLDETIILGEREHINQYESFSIVDESYSEDGVLEALSYEIVYKNGEVLKKKCPLDEIVLAKDEYILIDNIDGNYLYAYLHDNYEEPSWTYLDFDFGHREWNMEKSIIYDYKQ